jgi:hypothetical protein
MGTRQSEFDRDWSPLKEVGRSPSLPNVSGWDLAMLGRDGRDSMTREIADRQRANRSPLGALALSMAAPTRPDASVVPEEASGFESWSTGGMAEGLRPRGLEQAKESPNDQPPHGPAASGRQSWRAGLVPLDRDAPQRAFSWAGVLSSEYEHEVSDTVKSHQRAKACEPKRSKQRAENCLDHAPIGSPRAVRWQGRRGGRCPGHSSSQSTRCRFADSCSVCSRLSP